ncbi:MAG TPA: hypothetical protein PKD64_14355 [Pirellulaceae bacterium]|nr:hypothetical protein [Pirellulaceae bacterium]HMO93369.1 hypothetical protein [Pirellulaceae bacterium]HMP70428.1 hypothetical protein [Pirellulaceae bacterium]
MNKIDKLEQWLRLAKAIGIDIRYENLVGADCGLCQVGKRHIVFLDLNQGPEEHLNFFESLLDSNPSIRRAYEQSTRRESISRPKPAA